ncbi:MAG: DUF2142 domain-containing protein [Armatimonadota bacterium]
MITRGTEVTQDNASQGRWRSRPWSGLLVGCVAAYLVLGVAYALIFPLGQAPDEPAHFRYALFIARHARLPHFHADDAGYESYQAPLYYTLCAAVGKLAMLGPGSATMPTAEPPAALHGPAWEVAASLPDYPTVSDRQHVLAVEALRQAHRFTIAERRAWRAMRLVTVLVGACGVLLAWRILVLIFPDRPWIAAMTAATMAVHPMYVHICASVGNDPATVVAVELVLLLSLLIMREGLSPARAALLGLALGIAMLTKDSALAALPAALLALAWSAGRRHEPEPADSFLSDLARRVAALRWGRMLGHAAVALGVAAAVGGWWYVRNTLLYGTPQHFPANIDKQIPWQIYVARPDILGVVLDIALPMTFRNFWAGFGWTNVAVAPWIYWLLLGIALLPAPGLVMLIAHSRAGRVRCPALQVRGVWLLLLTAVVLSIAMLWYILTIDLGGGSQGRYLFPAFSALGMLWALGVGRLLRREARRALPWLAGGLMLAFNLYCLFGVIVPFYRALLGG